MQSEELETLLMQHFSHAGDREKGALFIQENPHHFDTLFRLACSSESKRAHVVSAWILEKYSLDKLDVFTPIMNVFIEGVSVQTHESKRRPMMKLLYHYCKKPERRNGLSATQIQAIINCGFTHMLDAQKIASIAFAIKTVAYFRFHETWVNEELNQFIINKLPNSSPGFRSMAKYIE